MAAMQALVVFAADARLPCGAAYLTVCEARELLLARLPLRARFAAASVCRAWRAALAEPTLWTRLVLEACCCDAMLRAASARARGRLELLDVSDAPNVTPDALVSVAAANAGALRELRGVGHSNTGGGALAASFAELYRCAAFGGGGAGAARAGRLGEVCHVCRGARPAALQAAVRRSACARGDAL
jgi:hypothetical protein